MFEKIFIFSVVFQVRRHVDHFVLEQEGPFRDEDSSQSAQHLLSGVQRFVINNRF